MPGSVYFIQSCPACGRSLQVRVNYLGKGVACQHCHAQFVAEQPNDSFSSSEEGKSLLERADELIQAAEASKAAKLKAAASAL